MVGIRLLSPFSVLTVALLTIGVCQGLDSLNCGTIISPRACQGPVLIRFPTTNCTGDVMSLDEVFVGSKRTNGGQCESNSTWTCSATSGLFVHNFGTPTCGNGNYESYYGLVGVCMKTPYGSHLYLCNENENLPTLPTPPQVADTTRPRLLTSSANCTSPDNCTSQYWKTFYGDASCTKGSELRSTPIFDFSDYVQSGTCYLSPGAIRDDNVDFELSPTQIIFNTRLSGCDSPVFYGRTIVMGICVPVNPDLSWMYHTSVTSERSVDAPTSEAPLCSAFQASMLAMLAMILISIGL